MKVLITGSSGFIGEKIKSLLEKENIRFFAPSRCEGTDFTDWEAVKNLPKCDVIIHLAAKTSVPESFEFPRDYYKNNLMSTLNTLELSKIWNSKMIFLSSYFYGPPRYIPVDENHLICPHNPYSASKYISEELCKSYSRDFDLDIIALRLFNVYGNNQQGNFLIPDILKQIDSGVVKLNDPRPRRDYIHINDVTNAIFKFISFKSNGFEVYNLGTGTSVSVDELVNLINKYSNKKFQIEYLNNYRKGEVLESKADISKLKRVLNWSPQIDIDTGLKLLFKN